MFSAHEIHLLVMIDAGASCRLQRLEGQELFSPLRGRNKFCFGA
ncbi:hypothetical protein NGR_b07410 (plasmid) [Sinorhizobium fredii NGR234]|uniref:Uncharacterized protein n=1 Tax=Sinorhizobium fredii (strain NBRC 101917 / NGR234) TaxID=394 RepID=C3KQ41_SINFN|nr:hypothetical protein NGR_b07410 [Sinorhizobium fredii NGR234]